MSYTDGNIQGGKFNKGEKYPGDLWDVRYHSTWLSSGGQNWGVLLEEACLEIG